MSLELLSTIIGSTCVSVRIQEGWILVAFISCNTSHNSLRWLGQFGGRVEEGWWGQWQQLRNSVAKQLRSSVATQLRSYVPSQLRSHLATQPPSHVAMYRLSILPLCNSSALWPSSHYFQRCNFPVAGYSAVTPKLRQQYRKSRFSGDKTAPLAVSFHHT